ncbi:fidelity protein 18 homolog [Seminavis robusta]|uniref:Fidelity protein 18 homolog n=1 Tax=Seminavis robusta TaxID=568900 RepID=A0A9N8HQ41_9STRA|nr:fidelity protein 18 homolog [Seminavis robusta]|eukprot:Sro1156_g247260.1 fidelity protein 18 homolog (1066) ;mRNA; r:9794-13196
MEEPDYDDMIEDYLDDFEEPPPTTAAYDDDFLEEMEAEAATEKNDNSAKEAPIPEVPSPASPISRDLTNRLRAASSSVSSSVSSTEPTRENHTEEEATTSPVSSPAAQVRTELAASRYQGGSTAPDPFSFERYQRTTSWRQEAPTSPSTMRAKEWKSRHQRLVEQMTSNSNSKTTNKTKAPDAQLLNYQKARNPHYSACKERISRKDKHLKSTPTEGHRNVPMTLGDGTRLFVRVIPEATRDAPAPKKTSQQVKHSYSLGISMTDLMRRVQAIQRKKEHDRLKDMSKELKQQQKNLTNNANDDSDDEEMEEAPPADQTTQEPVDDQLWVDKHAPSTFANLLSDERTNREVLRALRQWDPYVFKKDPPKRPQYYMQQQQQQENNDNDNKTKKDSKDKRPDERNRVLLLSGSPGVGKTTLAHIVARHCGYRPMEVNGSDERSATALKDRVIRAMETATLDVHNANNKGRPNCIILDEIDGADAKQALQALVELIRQEMPTANNSENKEGKKQAKQKRKPYLKRPIIFICNNLYAPALRPLLPYARRFEVEAPAPPRLVARLRAVLSNEGLSLWGGATLLHDLVASSGGDIRSSLFTLQFAAAQLHQQTMNHSNQKNRNMDITKSLQSTLKRDGRKDDRRDVAGTAMAVFKRLKNKGKNDRLWGTRQASDPRTSVERVLDAVESFGEHGKILDCMYLNIMNVNYVDPSFERSALALQWLSGADRRSIQQLYVPCAAAALHLLCRVEQKPDLTYTTRELTDNHYQLEANLGLTQKFAEGLSAKYRGSRTADSLVKETVPYALWMLSAGEGSSALSRPASSVAILKKKELEAFVKHSETLRSLGLTYVASRAGFAGPNNEYSDESLMTLEPPIHRLVHFQYIEAMPWSSRKEIPSATKELLAQRSTLQGIRDLGSSSTPRKDAASALKGTGTPQSTLKNLEAIKNAAKGESEASKSLPAEPKPVSQPSPVEDGTNKRNTVATKGSVEKGRPAKRAKPSPVSAHNFLGVGAKRAREKRSARRAKNVGFVRSTTEKKSHTGSGVPLSKVLRLKFVKGFTQAVRNPCRMEDLA